MHNLYNKGTSSLRSAYLLLSHFWKHRGLLRQNAEGRLYGITFVDNQNKVVFNGSDLGREYSVAALQNRLAVSKENKLIEDNANKDVASSALKKDLTLQKHEEKTTGHNIKNEGLLDILLSTREQYSNTPFGLLKRKKKKKRKNSIYRT